MSDLAERLARLSPDKLALLEKQLRERGDGQYAANAGIAIVGIGCRFPGGGDSPQTFWQGLVEGRDAIREVPADRWNVDDYYDPDSTARGKMATRRGGFLDGIENFDPAFFDLTNREALRMDPQQRLVMESTWAAFEDAGLVAAALAGTSTGVFISAHNLSSDYFLRQTVDATDIDPYSATGGAHSIIANRISYWLDLQGPSLTVDTACSGSLVAAHLAVNSLRAGECDVAIAGGTNLMLAPETTIALSGMQMMAPDGRCKTFDESANGFVRGEGCGIVILKRLADARRDGDAIYAVIRGSAVNQDGRTNGLTAPNGLAQQRVLQKALRQAGVRGEQVGFVETHGTGTALGDPIEVEALGEVLGVGQQDHRCVLGAVKTNIGHLESAAGIAGLIKTALCLHHEFIPPNLHFRKLNPLIDLAKTRFVVPTEGMPWPRGDAPRIAGVSSFGFGGTNAHMVLEDAPPIEMPEALTDEQRDRLLLVISARRDDELRSLAAAYAEALSGGKISFPDACFTAACRRAHFERRVAVTATGPEAAVAALRSFADGAETPEVIAGPVADGDRPGPVWVFSGQGSQHAGTGQRLCNSEPVFRHAIAAIDEIFVPLAGWSILDAVHTADDARLEDTAVAQPLIFAIQVGLAALLRHYGAEPAAVVGHSLGEVAAAHVSGVLSLEDAVTVIYHRGRLMQQLHGRGRMAAVYAPEAEVRDALRNCGNVSVAAVNGPAYVTVSGRPEELDAVLRDNELPNQVLPVQYAFHSAQTEPLQQPLADALSAIRPRDVRIPILSTVTGRAAEPGDFGPDYWASNIREPVAFADAIGELVVAGHACYAEIAPRPVLGPAILQCLEQAELDAAVFAALPRERPEAIRDALAQLHVNGVDIDWREYFSASGRATHLPAYQWQRQRCWFEAPSRSGSLQSVGPDVDEWFYEVVWALRTPLQGWPRQRQAPGMPLPGAVAQQVTERRAPIALEHGAVESRRAVRDLESLAAAYAAGAMQALGFDMSVGQRFSATDVAAVGKGHGKRILQRVCALLEEHGAIKQCGSHWVVCGSVADARQLQATIESSDGAVPDVVTLLRRCGREIAGVVNGDTDPLGLLFPGDYKASAEWVYAEAPFSRVANDLVAETVDALVDELPAAGTLRVLEIGAGTGGTTRTVLPRLPLARTEYLFTDISTSFLTQAKTKFGHHSALDYALLDIEDDPGEQGFATQQFDLIIAANVVHATQDLRRSLSNARSLLAPGGTLLLLEGTARRGWVDLTFGLTEGWWRFTDTDVRSDHPLLGAGRWRELLVEAGFADTDAIAVQADGAASLFEQSVLLARNVNDAAANEATSAAIASRSAAPWIIIADQGDVGSALAEQLDALGQAHVVARREQGALPTTPSDLRFDPGSRTACIALLETIAGEYGDELDTIVYLPALDEHVGEGDISFDWDASMTRSCGGLLHLMHALEETGVKPRRGVWGVTRGVQDAPGDAFAANVAQSPLWGMGRVAAREMPDAWGGLIDLDEPIDAARDAAAMIAQISTADDEDQVAVRRGERFVARLVAREPKSTPMDELPADRSYLVIGGLGGIGLQVANWLAGHGARHITLVGRNARAAAEGQASAALRDLEAAGAQVSVVSADVADPVGMAELLARFGADQPPLAGIIHTAAVVDFRSITEIAIDDMLTVARPKIAGSWVLHCLAAGHDIDFLVFFSSMAAIGGFPQLSHYAAANCFQDALAHHRAAQGSAGMSVNWGLWSQGRATSASNVALFERVGLRAMPTQAALNGLQRILAGTAVQPAIAWMDWSSFRPIYESRSATRFLENLPAGDVDAKDRRPPESATTGIREQLRDLRPGEAAELIESTLESELAAILSVTPQSLAGRTEGFFELGMDSIMAVEFRRRLESTLECRLPTTVAFEYPTISRLSQFIVCDVLSLGEASDVATDTAASAAEETAAAAKLDDLSTEDLRAILDSELAEVTGTTRGSGT